MKKFKSKEESEEDLLIAESVISSISDENLIAAKNFLDYLDDYKRLNKLYNTYIVGVKDSLHNTKNGRMYANYNIDGAVTGRLSNSGANSKRGGGAEGKLGVSFHTLPREQVDFNVREYVVAPPGWDFITIDKKAMELRVLAHVANERNMIKAFESRLDLHTYSAAMTFNKDPKDVTKEERQIAKAVSFLTVYGGEAYTLANKQHISEARAQRIINSWFDAYPGVRDYMATVNDYINQFKSAKTIFGRYRHLPNIDSPIKGIRKRAFRQGLNFTIQSPASDILICALIGLYNKLNEGQFTAKIVGTVHDSIELVSPKHETDRVIALAYNELVNYPYMRENFGINLRVPLEIDVEVGTSFGGGTKYDLSRLSS